MGSTRSRRCTSETPTETYSNAERAVGLRSSTASPSRRRLNVENDVAGIYGVATTQEGRGRGLATLLCTTALEEARADGATRTVLHSTPMARSLYHRMGYRDVATFEMWAAPDTLHL